MIDVHSRYGLPGKYTDRQADQKLFWTLIETIPIMKIKVLEIGSDKTNSLTED
jgi:hypothetical protein